MQYVLYKWKNQYGGKYNNKMNSMIVLPLQHYLSRKKQRNSTKERDYILQVQESFALRCKEARKVQNSTLPDGSSDKDSNQCNS